MERGGHVEYEQPVARGHPSVSFATVSHIRLLAAVGVEPMQRLSYGEVNKFLLLNFLYGITECAD